MFLDTDGILTGVEFVPSPNCDDRPPQATIDLIVIHGISLPPGEFGTDGVSRLFCNTLDHTAHPYYELLEGMRVSAHFFVRRDGHLLQFVPCSKRAWHAGVSSWKGRERCNDFSVGIELEGTDEVAYAEAQYAALAKLISVLRVRYPIQDVAGHSDIAPGRKTDPGPSFDWERLQKLLAAEA